ncbi:DNA mismatch repair protein MutL [Pseudobutyrivibrio sp. NOR37]|uniref:DNA mismatch repair protein MutL n=1 Tax=Pseudobutyrivibrio xylanivorans TaxID=185007 RepID=A0A6M0LGZ8_PSEXY|nr:MULTISPECIES: DNA mismatch repair endonuclease MutL [Pseudobutyrivibrio]NEX01167.1 DNA mismatch repair endonuclease MutL [Pseudobutyrivibrio xylanivorans]SFR65492.1 DNA mismatch repair protein MutL [Pseudobutyrivibrio sp. NOR37]
MGKINVLSQETIDKIAAGEVVERPASVAKELIENSIDAGATAISVEIKGGGIEYLRITDNGVGIEKDQIPVAFLRHSTSKIKDAEDLNNVHSLGFRGEALSSISAVSKVELITKTKDNLLGASYIIEGAKEVSLSDVGAPDGTTFIIRQLFYNTPARKKFLKAESTEGSYVFDVVEHLALSHPEISFKLIINGKEKLMTSGNGSLSDTIYQIYGRQIAANILDISYEDELFSITGYIGLSVIARGNRAFEHFFVNDRYIKSNNLSRACEEGYYGFLMGHQYPFFVLNIDCIDGAVDVNVHPTKQEVRFENESKVCEILTKAINSRLRRREDVVEAKVEEEKPRFNNTFNTIIPEPIEKTSSVNKSFSVEKATPLDTSSDELIGDYKSESSSEQEIKPVKLPEPFEKNRLEAIKASITSQIRKDTPYEKKFAEKNSGGEKYEQISFLTREAVKEHKIIGQVFDTYWIIEYDKNMYIIDQHAAHEKVLFEKTMARLKNKEMTSQMVSPPVIISLSQQDILLYERYHEAFESLGYRVESFGGNELAITAVPGNLFSLDPKQFFLEALADCQSYKASDSFDIIVERVASMSCKAAVKGNNRLSLPEIKTLINDLLELDNPYHCPHGRPTMISFSEYELAKKFKRIV